jgi:hypothetical protein
MVPQWTVIIDPLTTVDASYGHCSQAAVYYANAPHAVDLIAHHVVSLRAEVAGYEPLLSFVSG